MRVRVHVEYKGNPRNQMVLQYSSLREAARVLDCDRKHLAQIAKGERKQTQSPLGNIIKVEAHEQANSTGRPVREYPDQPEENLDPKSVYDELVGLFVQAKTKRQVILVTHNANLVINTEATQVLVASIGNNAGDGLPPITYRTGSLDDAATRHSVCDILEGGERAFRERAKRLGLT